MSRNTRDTIRKFREWMKLKIWIHFSERFYKYHEREVWWAAVGKNIGVEIGGKGPGFARPVLVYKKINRLEFMAIPLTSQPHNGNWYVPIRVNDGESRAVLVQAKTMSALRLYRKMGEVSQSDFARVKKSFLDFYG